MWGDSDLAVCMDAHGENWEKNFLAQIGQGGPEQQETKHEEMNDDPPPMQVQTYKEVISST